MSENLSLLPSHPHRAEVPGLSHVAYKVQNRISEQVHPVQKTRTSRGLCVVCSYFPVLGKLDSHAVSERSSQSHRGCHRLQIHGCSEQRGSMDASFRGACGKCVLRWNNPCLSVAAGGPLPGLGGVVLPGQHPPGHLRLGLLVWERRRPLRPAGSQQPSRPLLNPVTNHTSATLVPPFASLQKQTEILQDTSNGIPLWSQNRNLFLYWFVSL